MSKKWHSHFFELGCTKFCPRCRRRKLRITRICVDPDACFLRCSSSPRKARRWPCFSGDPKLSVKISREVSFPTHMSPEMTQSHFIPPPAGGGTPCRRAIRQAGFCSQCVKNASQRSRQAASSLSKKGTAFSKQKAVPFWPLKDNYPLLWMYSSMDLAADFPAPMARMTVAAPVAASPPAKMPGQEVHPPSSAATQPLRVRSRPGVPA